MNVKGIILKIYWVKKIMTFIANIYFESYSYMNNRRKECPKKCSKQSVLNVVDTGTKIIIKQSTVKKAKKNFELIELMNDVY